MRIEAILTTATLFAATLLASPLAAQAQWQSGAQAGGSTAAASPAPHAHHSGGLRLALQARLNAFELFGNSTTGNTFDTGFGTITIPAAMVPIATPGVRLLDDRLFIGAGFGYMSAHYSRCSNDPNGCDAEKDTFSISSWSLSPLAQFDLIKDPDGMGALYIVGWLNLGSLNSTTTQRITPGRTDTTDVAGQFWWGLNAGVGLRGNISESVAFFTEWGWGFATTTDDGNRSGPPDDRTLFVHGFFGTLGLEASVGL